MTQRLTLKLEAWLCRHATLHAIYNLVAIATHFHRLNLTTDGKEAVSKERDVAKESKGVAGSWSAVVHSNTKMKKYEHTIRDVDGVPTIRVPKEVIEKSTPLWEDMLVEKFQSTTPYVGKIHVLVNKIWPLGEKMVKIDAIVVEKTTIKFRIKDQAVWNRVLCRGMWNICGIPMIISKWSAIEQDAQPDVKTMPVWVVVKNVPRYMYAWEGFAFMTSLIGEPIRLHPGTKMYASKTTVEQSSQVEKPVLDEIEQENKVYQDQIKSGTKEKDETLDPKKGADGDQEEGLP
ncbi:putative non-LTR retroelement reverse transcriptase, partial [Tanacetum coccineum]